MPVAEARILPSRARRLLNEAVEQDRAHELAPIAIKVTLAPGYTLESDKTLFEPSVLIEPVPHPVLAAALTLAGATPRGAMSWAIGFGDYFTRAPLTELYQRVAAGTLMFEGSASTAKKPRVLGVDANRSYNLHRALAGTKAATSTAMLDRAASRDYPTEGAAQYGAVTLDPKDTAVWIRFNTHQLEVPDGYPKVPLNLRPAGKNRVDAKPVRPADAVAVLDWLVSEGFTLVNGDDDLPVAATLRAKVAGSLIATPAPGQPALADVSLGRNLFRVPGLTMPAQRPDATRSAVMLRMNSREVATHAEAILAHLGQDAGKVHPGTADAGRMALAVPAEAPQLRSYQREAVGIHQATDIGYLQSCAPGMGKTVIQYAAMQARASGLERYRALVVVEANVREQWSKEAVRWFPEARVVPVFSRSDAPQLAEALEVDGPVVAIVSYGLLPAVKAEMERRAVAAELLEPVAQRPERHAGTPGERPQGQPALAADNAGTGAKADDASQTGKAGDATGACAPAKQAVKALPSGFIPTVTRAMQAGQTDLFSLLAELEQEAIPVPAVTVQPGKPGRGSKVKGHLSLVDGAATDPADDPATDQAVADGDLQPVTRTLGALLLDTFWHDLAADEAEVLRGTGSKQSAALWELRANAQVAVALTGTPINRDLDDLGRLMAWCRGDEHLFHGVRLSTQFDVDTAEGRAAFLEAMGPLLFRRDSSEIADELPQVHTTLLRLTPTPEEKALASAARDELKRVYLELVAYTDMLAEADPDNPEIKGVQQALTEARGAWLGGTQLARMASSDPAALLGSQSAGAALLAGQGLIEAATRRTGTKRAAVVEITADRVAQGRKVLIFTEFATVANGLIADLDEAGVRVGAVLGGGGRARDRMIAQFQQGELDVLVCTSSGERGLNLQQASVIIHYDLPWTPKGVIQRTGRARRIASENRDLEVIFPLMSETIEERVAALVVSRAVEAMNALDASRGVDTTQTEMGLALSGLVDAVTQAKVAAAGRNALLAMTEALVA